MYPFRTSRRVTSSWSPLGFSAEPPEDEAVVLQVDPDRLDAPLFRHTETGTYLVYRPRAHLPFLVHVASTLDLDVAPADFPAFRGALIAALCEAGVEVAPDDEPVLEDEPST